MREDISTLLRGAPVPAMSIDPAAVLAGGRRRRRRRVTAVAGTAAATLVLGVAGWAVLSQRAADERTLPATTSSHSVNGVTTELRLGAIPQTGRTQPLVSALTVDQVTGSLDFVLRTEAGAVLASRPSVPGGPDRTRWATLIPGVTVALLPTGATGAAPIWIGEPTSIGSAATRTPDGRVLVAWWTDGSSYETFCDVIWTEGETAHSAYHDVALPSVVIDDTVFFFGSVGPTYLGYIGPSRGTGVLGTTAVQLTLNIAPDQLPAVWADLGEAEPATSPAHGLFATRLPAARGDVNLETIDGAEVTELTTYDLGGVNGIMLVAELEGPHGSVAGVTYTDPSSGTVTGVTEVE